MRVSMTHPLPGIPGRALGRLHWSADEQDQLARTLTLIRAARHRVGPDSDAGAELGKAEVVLADCLEGVTLDELPPMPPTAG